jgi:hypothetical protein
VTGEMPTTLSRSRVRCNSFNFFRLAHFDGQIYNWAHDAYVHNKLNQKQSKDVGRDVDTERYQIKLGQIVSHQIKKTVLEGLN